MSVINRMLSELDARQQPLPTAWAFQAITPPTLPPLRSNRRAWALAISGSALIGALVWTDAATRLADAADPSPLAEAAVTPATDLGPDASTATAATSAPPAPTSPQRPLAQALAEVPRKGAPSPSHRTAQARPLATPAVAITSTAATASTLPAVNTGHDTPDAATAAAALLDRAPTGAGPLLATVQPSNWAVPAKAPAQTPAPTPAPAHTQAPPTPAADTPASAASIEKQVLTPSPSQRAAIAYRQAVELAAAGHSTQAIEQATDALKADPDHVPARQLAAALMFEKQRLPEALSLLRSGLERRPGQPQLTYLLARIKAETGDNAAALALLAQTKELGADGHGLRAVLLARQGDHAAAVGAYEAALRLANDNPAWWVGLGAALESNGQPAQARQAYLRARGTGALHADLRAFVDRKLGTP